MVVTIPQLTGRRLEEVDGSAAPGQWIFRFGEKHCVNVECDWRIVVDGRIALAARDHEQPFGLPKPVDAVKEAERLLKGKKVTQADLGPIGDLVLTFDGRERFETFTNSSGYESCTVGLPGGQLIVMGGGNVVKL